MANSFSFRSNTSDRVSDGHTRQCDMSVAICTYNGRERLPRVIERLRSQILVQDLVWELLIVDNNSTDGTAEWVQALIQQLQKPELSHQCLSELGLSELGLSELGLSEPGLADQREPQLATSIPSIRYILEPQQGTAFARHRAIAEAQSPWVACLDDDNLPHPNWLSAVYDFAQAHPQAGAFHGKILGDYERTPPEDFDRIAPFWAIGGGKKPRCYTEDAKATGKRLFPPGAGIIVQREAWLTQVPSRLNLVGRLGSSLVGGEDIEAMTYLSRGGWEIWYSPEICLDHRIAQHRLTHTAIVAHMRGVGLGRWQLRRLGLAAWKQPIALCGFWLNDLRKWIQHRRQYRSQLRSNPVVIAEQAFFKGCLQSPFYGWLLRS